MHNIFLAINPNGSLVLGNEISYIVCYGICYVYVFIKKRNKSG